MCSLKKLTGSKGCPALVEGTLLISRESGVLLCPATSATGAGWASTSNRFALIPVGWIATGPTMEVGIASWYSLFANAPGARVTAMLSVGPVHSKAALLVRRGVARRHSTRPGKLQ